MRIVLGIMAASFLLVACRDEKPTTVVPPAKPIMYRPANGICAEQENWASPTAMRDNMQALSIRMAENPNITKKHLDDAVKIIMCVEKAKAR